LLTCNLQRPGSNGSKLAAIPAHGVWGFVRGGGSGVPFRQLLIACCRKHDMGGSFVTFFLLLLCYMTCRCADAAGVCCPHATGCAAVW
jgi:hypothetical protein